jgi:hypothetical protein
MLLVLVLSPLAFAAAACTPAARRFGCARLPALAAAALLATTHWVGLYEFLEICQAVSRRIIQSTTILVTMSLPIAVERCGHTSTVFYLLDEDLSLCFCIFISLCGILKHHAAIL